jgi:predicted lysophospholipase L1 biosynthesis ABC-type transport system permease subunit
LVLVLLAGQRAVSNGVAAYAGQEGVDLWVAPRGTDNLIRSSGLLPIAIAHAIERMDGVARSGPLLRGFVTARPLDSEGSEARPISLLAIGYRGPDGLGGPVEVTTGRRPEGMEEAALDRAAAFRLGVAVGDRISLNDQEVAVVGLTRGTDLVATQFVFVDASEAERASGYRGQASFVLLKLEEGVDPDALSNQLEQTFSQVVVHQRASFVRNNLAEVSAGFGGILLLMSTVGVISAALLVALLVQGAVDDRRRDVAVLLAMGASLLDVAVGVVWHVATVLGAGDLLGAVSARVLGAVLVATMPTVHLAPSFGDLAVVSGVFGGAGLVAAAIPLWRLRRIDPVEAFRP